jgi:hypothetical protein
MAVPELSDWISGLDGDRVTWGGAFVALSAGIYVTPTPLRLDGVFWGITARDLQLLADELGAQLLTPMAVDLIRDRAACRLSFAADASSGRPDMAGEAAMRRYSAALDKALRAAGVDPDASGDVLCCTGAKDWVLTRDLQIGHSTWSGKPLPLRNQAVNYGAFVASGFEASVTGRYRVIQSPGYAHDTAHRDYSQLGRLAIVEAAATLPAHDGCTLRRLPSVPSGGGPPPAAAGGAGGMLAALALAAAFGIGV